MFVPMASCCYLILSFKNTYIIWIASKPVGPWNYKQLLPHLRESEFRNPGNFCSWNPESGKILLLESGILGLGPRNTAQGIRNPTKDWNLESKLYWNPVPGIRNSQRRIQNPRLSRLPLRTERIWGKLSFFNFLVLGLLRCQHDVCVLCSVLFQLLLSLQFGLSL